MSQSNAVAAELQSGSMSISKRSLISNEGSKSMSIGPSIHSSDDTVVRRGDGQFKKTDPKRIAHDRNNSNISVRNLLKEGHASTKKNGARTHHTIQEENPGAGVTCGCNWFRRWKRKEEHGLRWV